MVDHYIDNEKFYNELVAYKDKLDECRLNGTNLPRVTDYIGKCFFDIATKLSFRYNFINYSYRDEMVSYGIEQCLSTLERSDPRKAKNQFRYYTYITYFAFVRKIKEEKEENDLKYRMLDNVDLSQLVNEVEDEEMKNYLTEMYREKIEKLDKQDSRERVKKVIQKSTSHKLF